MKNTNINYTTRIDALRAMDLIARSLSDEDFHDTWLMYGIEDACTDYDYYANDDDTFCEMMTVFCNLMKEATKDKGALCIDHILSR